MGGCVVTFGFNDKIKTVEAAKKDFAERAEQDRYENGHSYSGTMGMLHSLRYLDRVFDSVSQFTDFLGGQDKDQGFLAQVKVVRETKPLIAAGEKMWEANRTLWDAKRANKAPSVIRTLQARLDRAVARKDELYAKAAAKSTKTRLVGGGVCSS